MAYVMDVPLPYGCSFGVITIVPEAHDLFRRGVGDPTPTVRAGLSWTVAELPANGGGSHVVVEGLQLERSHQPAQAFAAALLKEWRPRCLLVADIGGGIHGGGDEARDGLHLGDVVVAERLHYYELQKVVAADPGEPDRVQRYIRWQPTSPSLSSLARDLSGIVDWHSFLQIDRPPSPAPVAPQLRLGELVCGDKLLTDPDAAETKYIVNHYDKALAVDMETVGIAHAALMASDAGLAVSFVALRGVSDWIDREDNQETRDNWKPAACDAAIAAARGLIEATPPLAAGATIEELQSVEELTVRLMGSYRIPTDGYDSVVRTPEGTITRNDALIRAATRRGLALIGRAGLGKSTMLHQAALASTSPLEAFPVLIDLKLWKPAYAERLAADPSGADLLPSMDALLRASVQRIGVDLLQQIVARRDVMLFVDGLNEVPFTEVASRMLVLLDEYMRAYPRARILVTDRGDAAFYGESGWERLHLDPLDAAEVKRVVAEHLGQDAADGLGAVRELLRIPFFLQRAMEGSNIDLASRASALEVFFSEHLGLSDEQIAGLANMAFEIYADRHQRSFTAGDVEAAVGAGALESLRSAEALIGDVDHMSFGHQLEHDFLAACHLAGDAGLWTTEVLDAVSFKAASSDVLAMTIEQLDEVAHRDAFVRRLYDWNWRATITAMASAEQEDQPSATEHLRSAVLAVAAEKRFDRVAGSRDRAEAQLARFPGSTARDMAHAVDLDALIGIVAHIDDGPAWFVQWQRVFCRGTDLPLEEPEVELIGAADALLGWTMANVARRFAATSTSSLQVRTIYGTHPAPTAADRAARWRAVHAVGAWPNDENADMLITALDDEYSWVIYGAVRSLVEMAARTGDDALRGRVTAALLEHLDRLAPESLGQIALASLYDGAALGYREAIRPVLDAIYDRQHTAGERRRWESRVGEFEAFWARQASE